MSDQTDVRPDATPEPWPRAESVLTREGAHADHDDRSNEAVAWISGGAGTGETRYAGLRLALLAAVVIFGAYKLGIYVLLVIAALIVSVVLHEFGHYWTAKRCGMKVTEFFVGLGPRLWSFRRGETEYGIKPFPIAAYVRIIGMNNLEEVDPADESRAYRNQSAPKRIAVVLAGPFMNLLIAFVLLMVVFMFYGKSSPDSWRVYRVGTSTAAQAAGMQPGDRIVSIDGDKVASFDNFKKQLDEKAGQPVTLVVQRNGQELTLQFPLGWRFNADVANAIPSTPALDAKSDHIVSVDGKDVASYAEFRKLLTDRTSGTATIRIERGSHPYELAVNVPLQLPENGSTGFLGISPDPDNVRETPVGALGETGRLFGSITTGMGAGIGHLFSPSGIQNYASQVADGSSSPNQNAASQPNTLTPVDGSPPPNSLSSDSTDARPVSIIGIVQAGSSAAQTGVWDFLMLVALVNIALALINLLPILPFDGGHAAIASYEGIRGAIRGRPYRVDITKLLPLTYAFMAVLVLLAASSAYLDVIRPVSYGP